MSRDAEAAGLWRCFLCPMIRHTSNARIDLRLHLAIMHGRVGVWEDKP